MKQIILSCLLCLCLLVAGCAAQSAATTDPVRSTQRTEPEATQASTGDPASTTETEELTAPTTEPLPTQTDAGSASDLTENEAFLSVAGPCDNAIVGVLYNAPFVDGEPKPTVVWNEGQYDQLVIYPRYVGSEVSVWSVVWEGEDQRLDGPVYTAVCEQGDCFAAALDRPEGLSAWVVSVKAPSGAEAGLELTYNGRYGTYAYEYLTDDSASELHESLPEQESLYELETVLGAEELHSFLRAAARQKLDPWAAMQRCCTPLAELGVSAAHTVCEGEMNGNVYTLQTAKLREGYDPGEGSLEERVRGQAERYAELGNADGILGPDKADAEALYYDLTGLTVYNPTLLAQTVSVTVNGEALGSFRLTEGDFCTLLELNVTSLPADAPIQVELHVEQSCGADGAAILEAWPGIGGNISGER